MSHTLREWIAPLAEKEFLSLLDASRSLYHPGQALQDDTGLFNQGVATVRLKKGQSIQIVDFNGRHEYPFDVTVSDGTTKIRATFSSKSTQEFSRRYGREFCDGTLGGVLGITDSSLIYNPKLGPSKRLMLQVSDFKLLGSEGSRTFYHPSNIEERESLWIMLSKLDDFLSGSGNNDTIEQDLELEILSQAGDLDDMESSSPTNIPTQTLFGTQVPGKVANCTLRPTTTKTKVPSVSKGINYDELISMLEGNEPGAQTGEGFTSEDTMVDQSSRIIHNIAKPAAALQLVSDDRKSEMSSRLGAKANLQHSQSSILSSDPKNDPMPATPLFSIVIQYDESEKENSQESLGTEKPQGAVSRPHNVSPAQDSDPREISRILIGQLPERDPFEGLKRVPRRYVRVSQDQQALLEKQDSWFQWAAGNRSSCANIPPEVMQDLNSFIDRKSAAGGDETYEESEGREADTEPVDEDCDSDIDDTEEVSNLPNEGKVQFTSVEAPDPDSICNDWSETRLSHPKTIPGSHAQKAGQVLDETTSDEEFVSSWPESLHPNQCDNLEPAPASSSEDAEISLDELANDGVAGITIELPQPLHNAIAQPPSATNIHRSENLNLTQDYTFSPCSVEDEEELELVVPYNIDDEVRMSNTEMGTEVKTPQELPSMAVQHQTVVQVKRTPCQKIQPLSTISQSLNRSKRQDGEISSYPIIPATFYAASSQKHRQMVNRNATSSDARQLLGSSMEEEHHPPHDDLCVSEVCDIIKEEDQMAQQLFIELEYLQPDKSETTSPSILTDTSARQRLTIPQKDMTPASNQEASHPHSLPPQMSSPFQIPLPVRGYEREDLLSGENSPSKPDALKRGSRDLGPNDQRIKRRRFIKPFVPSQQKHEARDIIEMARANRHNFLSQLSKPKGESPVVQITQSQPMSHAARQPSVDQSLADSVFTQPSADFVRSSTQEMMETTVVQHNSDLVTAPADVSREISTGVVLERSEVSKTTKSIEPSEPREPALDDEATVVGAMEVAEAVHTPTGASSGSPDDIMRQAEELEHDEEVELSSAAPQLPQATKGNRQSVPSSHPTAFEVFKSAYPEYGGKLKDFVDALVYLEWLVKTKGEHFLRASLWDDFIRTLVDEYREYLSEIEYKRKVCPLGEKIKTGWEYFNKIDKPPIFQDRILTPYNLQKSLLTLDPEQINAVRSRFCKPKPPGPLGPESSAGRPSVASGHLWNDHTNETAAKSAPIDITGAPIDGIGPEAPLSKGPPAASTRRRFFETPSQVQADQATPTSSVPTESDLNIEVLLTSKSRKTLPWEPSPTPRDKPSIPTSSTPSRIQPAAKKPREQQEYRALTSFQGSPASPILGEREPASRSFSAIDFRTGTIGSSSDVFKTPSAPVPSAAFRRQANKPKSAMNDARKAEGRLSGQKPTPLPSAAFEERPTSWTPVSSVSSVHSVGKDAKASGKKPSFSAFLKRKRESGGLGSESEKVTNASGKKVPFSVFLKRRRESGGFRPRSSMPELSSGTTFSIKPKTKMAEGTPD